MLTGFFSTTAFETTIHASKLAFFYNETIALNSLAIIAMTRLAYRTIFTASQYQDHSMSKMSTVDPFAERMFWIFVMLAFVGSYFIWKMASGGEIGFPGSEIPSGDFLASSGLSLLQIIIAVLLIKIFSRFSLFKSGLIQGLFLRNVIYSGLRKLIIKCGNAITYIIHSLSSGFFYLINQRPIRYFVSWVKDTIQLQNDGFEVHSQWVIYGLTTALIILAICSF
jgi:hypothetical protein